MDYEDKDGEEFGFEDRLRFGEKVIFVILL
jgi:hypothetical protein